MADEPPENPTPETAAPAAEQPAEPQPSAAPSERVVVKEIIKEVPVEKVVTKEVVKEVPIVDEKAVEQKVATLLQTQQQERRNRAQQVRIQRRAKRLASILTLAQKERVITNHDVREYLHVSQSTASNYLTHLVQQGKLSADGKGRGRVYRMRK